MKISLITPIYNEGENIGRYFEALRKIKYPNEDLELVVVNDGSTDGSFELLNALAKKSEFSVRIINLEKNSGRPVARQIGAKEAKYENLLFLDCKCELFPDAISNLEFLNYQPVILNVIQKNDHIFDRFFRLIRRRHYRGETNDGEYDHYIDKDNFDYFPKGTILFCDRKLFLESQPEDFNSKLVSDDTRLLRNIVERKKIRRSSKARVYYNTRRGLLDNLEHMYHRGPKFADYYYRPSKKWFWLINLFLLGLIVTVYLGIKYSLLVEILFGALSLNFLLGFYFAEGIKDFLIVFSLFPIIFVFFFAGIVKGIIWKLWRKLTVN